MTAKTLFLTLLALLVASAHAAATDTMLSLFSASQSLSVGPVLFAILVILEGLLVCVAGYWLLRGVFFAFGFVIGAVATAITIEHFFQGESWLELASWAGFVVGGLVFGVVVLSLYNLSIFLVGAAGGVLLAFVIHAAIGSHVHLDSGVSVLFVILAIALGIVVGMLTFLLEKPLIIVITSLFGAVAVAWGVGFLAGGLPTSSQLAHTASETDDGDSSDAITTGSIPTAWWVYLVGIGVLFVAGVVIQFRITRGYHHKQSRPGKFQRSAFLRPVPAPVYTGRAPVVYMYAHPSTNNRDRIAIV